MCVTALESEDLEALEVNLPFSIETILIEIEGGEICGPNPSGYPGGYSLGMETGQQLR